MKLFLECRAFTGWIKTGASATYVRLSVVTICNVRCSPVWLTLAQDSRQSLPGDTATWRAVHCGCPVDQVIVHVK